MIAPLRDLGPDLNTITEIPTAGLFALHMDPPGPTPARANGMLLDDLPPTAIDALVACVGHGSGSPLLSVEQALLPWGASIHYANFGVRPDPMGVFTGPHPVTST
jgi:hypothetical protein